MTKYLRWRDLEDVQREFCLDPDSGICNGCGGSGSWFNPPDYIFKQACHEHDFAYWVGGDSAQKKLADAEFRVNMRLAIKQAIKVRNIAWYKVWWYRGACWRYFKSVTTFGGKYFNNTDVPKTITDLQTLMREKGFN